MKILKIRSPYLFLILFLTYCKLLQAGGESLLDISTSTIKKLLLEKFWQDEGIRPIRIRTSKKYQQIIKSLPNNYHLEEKLKEIINSYNLPYNLAERLYNDQNILIDEIIAARHHRLIMANGRLFVWGHNNDGQLGIGNYQTQTFPTELSLSFLENDEKILELKAGAMHTALLSSKNRIFVWGANIFGQLGLGPSVQPKNNPTELKLPLLTGETVLKMTNGSCHMLILTSSNRLLVWGKNGGGELGLADNQKRYEPTALHLPLEENEKIIYLEAGSNHTIIQTSNKRVFTWGYNKEGQLGLGDTEDRYEPTLLPLMLQEGEIIHQMAAGLSHTIILSSTGQVFVWGNNGHGKLGTGDDENHYTPVSLTLPLLEGETVYKLSAGSFHTLLLTSLGRVLVWGDNKFGQLGLGDKDSRNKPSELVFLLKENETIDHLAAGNYHSFFITSMGRIFISGNIMNSKTPIELSMRWFEHPDFYGLLPLSVGISD